MSREAIVCLSGALLLRMKMAGEGALIDSFLKSIGGTSMGSKAHDKPKSVCRGYQNSAWKWAMGLSRSPREMKLVGRGVPTAPLFRSEVRTAGASRPYQKHIFIKGTALPFLLVDGLDLLLHVIHQQILAQCVGSSEVGFATAHLCDLLHELDEPVIRR